MYNESQSIFNYTLSGRNFSYYSNQLHTPTFLDRYVYNITALLSKANISANNETFVNDVRTTCRNYTQCLLAVARTGNIFAGELIMDKLNKDEYERAQLG